MYKNLSTQINYAIISLLYIGVYFVPTFFIKGRVSSIIAEVYPSIQTIASGKRNSKGTHPPVDSAGNKITLI